MSLSSPRGDCHDCPPGYATGEILVLDDGDVVERRDGEVVVRMLVHKLLLLLLLLLLLVMMMMDQ